MIYNTTCNDCNSNKHVSNSVYHFAEHTDNLAAKYLVSSYVNSPKFLATLLGITTLVGLGVTATFIPFAISSGALGPILVTVILGILVLSNGGATVINILKSERAKNQFKTQPAHKVISKYNANNPYPNGGLSRTHVYYGISEEQIQGDIRQMMEVDSDL